MQTEIKHQGVTGKLAGQFTPGGDKRAYFCQEKG